MLTRVEHGDAAGINNVEWDAVELPSQFMENWVYHKPTLYGFAKHYETGEPMPLELYNKVKAAKNFQAGLQVRKTHLVVAHPRHSVDSCTAPFCSSCASCSSARWTWSSTAPTSTRRRARCAFPLLCNEMNRHSSPRRTTHLCALSCRAADRVRRSTRAREEIHDHPAVAQRPVPQLVRAPVWFFLDLPDPFPTLTMPSLFHRPRPCSTTNVVSGTSSQVTFAMHSLTVRNNTTPFSRPFARRRILGRVLQLQMGGGDERRRLQRV